MREEAVDPKAVLGLMNDGGRQSQMLVGRLGVEVGVAHGVNGMGVEARARVHEAGKAEVDPC